MTDEQRDINRRVAVNLGWRWVRLTFVSSFESRVTIRFMPPTFKASVTTGVDYLNVAGEPESHDEDFRLLPPYCTDPAAADLVRQEIERRGWDWWVYRFDGVYHSDVTVPIEGGKQEYTRDDNNSPHMALCLAFLAACDATDTD